MLVLALDTATPTLVAGLADWSQHGVTEVLAERAVPSGTRHAELLTPAISSVLDDAGLAMGDLDAVVTGLGDEHWRPAEMCLKVVAAHDVAGAGDGAAALAGHDLPRVRAAALRALAVAGDTEHVEAVQDRLDDPDAAVRRTAARSLERLARRLDLA